MHAASLRPPDSPTDALARRSFGVALVFLAVVAGLGTLLRLHPLHPVPGLNYAHILHTHSHAAFLGWVFNALFALALGHLTPPAETRSPARLFVVLQIAVLGMLVSYPLQGYGPVSTAFSGVHMVVSGVFAWKLWRRNVAVPAARPHLRAALVFLLASGLGPLALGPLAANGLRDTPAYQLAIYFYLHCQYNGWFLFFLQAVLFQSMALRGLNPDARSARKALIWLATGCGLTFAQSTLWLDPPGWVFALAAVGGAAQFVGCFHLLRAARGAGVLFGSGPARWLATAALGAFLLKQALQFGAALPGLAGLVNHRFIAIAFLHLVFLGAVTPAVFAWALRLGWLQDGRTLRGGLGLFIGGATLTELLLVAGPLVGFYSPRGLLVAAFAMTGGAALLITTFVIRRRDGSVSPIQS